MNITKNNIIKTLKEMIVVSQTFSEKIKNSKTKLKADTYRRKLIKNNKVVANLLIVLDKMENKEHNNQT